MSLKQKMISIRRLVPDVKVWVTTGVAPGSIVILRDDEGSLAKESERVLLGQPRDEREGVMRGDAPLPRSDIATIGFGPVTEDHPSAGSYLLSLGLHEDQCQATIDRFELTDQAYLPFRLLPATAQRQLQLIALMQESRALVVLNDPFMPFNGRWRETFAELLLDYVKNTSTSIVVLHLNFMPKSWAEKREVRLVDLGEEQERAVQKHFALKIEEEKKKTEVQQQRPASSAPVAVLGEPISSEMNCRNSSSGLWWKDRLVENMASFSGSVRHLHGAVAAFGLAFVLLGIGIVSYPEAARGWGKMHELAEHFADQPQQEGLALGQNSSAHDTGDEASAVVQGKRDIAEELRPSEAALESTELDEPIATVVSSDAAHPGEQWSSLVTEFPESLSDGLAGGLQCTDSMVAAH